MKCEWINCNVELEGRKRRFCSISCQRKDYYTRNKDMIKKRVRKWEAKNPERKARNSKKALEKFRKEKREQFNGLMRNQYRKHKGKWDSRAKTREIINAKRNPKKIKKECRECKSKKNISLKFEVYPPTKIGIKRAITQGKIYYLCKECRFK